MMRIICISLLLLFPRNNNGHNFVLFSESKTSSSPPSFIKVIPSTIGKKKIASYVIQTIHNNNKNLDIDLTNYDFASKQGWDSFYQRQQPFTSNKDNPLPTSPPVPFEFEWHSSINISKIILPLIPKGINRHILLVGNGNSNLPKLIHDYHDGDIHITCLDYSQPCIDMLKTMYPKNGGNIDSKDRIEYSNIEFVCGDATKLKDCINDFYCDQKTITSFDVIIDKGLMDAMMCNEGWNASLDAYFEGVSSFLKKRNNNDEEESKVILISYKLSTSTKDYLVAIGQRFGIEWDLDIVDKSNDRVSVSIGR